MSIKKQNTICSLVVLILLFISYTGCSNRTELPKSVHFRKIVDKGNSSTIHITRKGIVNNNKVISSEDSLISILDCMESPPTPKILLFLDKDYPFQYLDTLVEDLQFIRLRLGIYLKVNSPQDSCYLQLHFPWRNEYYNELDSIQHYRKIAKNRYVFIQKDSLKRVLINGEIVNYSEAINHLTKSFQSGYVYKRGLFYYIEYNKYNTVSQIVSLIDIYKKAFGNYKDAFMKKHKISNDTFPNSDVEHEYYMKVHRKRNIIIIPSQTINQQ
ncbi:hypothetical protein [Carboxylicivirga sp. RSCT41]|uniref:hypothetical protein n=1 Tax=Carboxylicivirga agarovorans TaxID=3417570 RepID=UPI003D32C701